jgi:concentrative nucleoside transporter, CNT family
MDRAMSFIGLFVMMFVCFLFSEKKKAIAWRTVIAGLLLQVTFGLFILKTDLGLSVFSAARDFFNQILGYTMEGSRFIFGSLVDTQKSGFIFFTMVLPTIMFMSALMSVLYHIGIMQFVIKITAKVMMKVMKTSGAESMSAAANIFAGQTEAPLVVKPFVATMTRSELMALMTGGMATIAGGVLAAYVGLGIDAGHLLAASVMSAPAALLCAKLLVPETEVSETEGSAEIKLEKTASNIIDAAAEGASEGVKLAINVGGMLLVFIALIALLNGMIGGLGGLVGFPELSLEWITGRLFAPVAFLMGIPWEECMQAGVLLGKKLVVNEFVAYLDLQQMSANLSPRTVTIMTYALCGFSNFGSIAIQLGGIGTMAPNRRKDLASLGLKSLLGGTIACLMTACIAGLMV